MIRIPKTGTAYYITSTPVGESRCMRNAGGETPRASLRAGVV